MFECDGVSASLKEHESRDNCSLRPNLRNESNRSEESEKGVKSSAKKKKNFWQTFSLIVRNECKFLKAWQKKKQKKQNLIILFFFLHYSKLWHKNVTQQFPPSIIAETRVKICQLVAQMEAKALQEQNQKKTSGFPFHNFLLFLHLISKCPVIPVTVTFRQHPVSHLLKCRPLHTLTTDSSSHVSPSEPVAYPGILFAEGVGGVQQIQLKTERTGI